MSFTFEDTTDTSTKIWHYGPNCTTDKLTTLTVISLSCSDASPGSPVLCTV